MSPQHLQRARPTDVHLSRLTLALCCLVMFMACVLRNIHNLPLYLGDSDDALRLVQVRQFIAGAGWFDMRIDRLAPPEGYVSHWSRIPDAIMFGIHWLAAMFVGPQGAEYWMRAIYPGLWIIPAYLASVFMSYRLFRSAIVPVAVLLLVAGNYGTFTQFLAGRIDHHGAQISLAVLAIAFAAMSESKPIHSMLSAISTSLCLAIGLEALPLLLVAPAMFVVRFAFKCEGLRELRAYLVTLAVSIIVALAITLPPNLWHQSVCDAIAANLSFGIAAGALSLLVGTYLPTANTTVTRRFMCAFAAGTVAAATYIFLNPHCVHGPFAEVVPALRMQWLESVDEMTPAISFASYAEFVIRLPLVIGLVPGIPALIWLMTMPKYRNNFALQTIAIGFITSLILGLYASRSILYCIWLVAPILYAAAAELFLRLGTERKILAAIVVGIFSPIALGTGLPQLLPHNFTTTTFAKNGDVASDKVGTKGCSAIANFDALSKLRQGLVLADFDLGSQVLALTNHQVYAASYHRIGNQILATIQFFGSQDPATSKAFAKANGISYVLVCKNSALPAVLSKPSLYDALLKHQQPEWLSPVAVTEDNPIEVYQVQ